MDPTLYSYRVNYPLDWSENTFCWNYTGGWEYYGPLATGVIHTGTSNHYQFESSVMTNLVEEWYDGTRENGGFAIAATLNLGYSNVANLYSKEGLNPDEWPELVIFYDPPSPPPAPTNFIADPIEPTQIELAWDYSAIDPDHFRLERNHNNQGWEFVGNIGGGERDFFENPLPPGTYQYRIRAEVYSLYSDWTYSNIVTIEGTGILDIKSDEMPTTFSLKQNYPNPFNSETAIRFSVPRLSNILVEVYNNIGIKVAELVNVEVMPGFYEIQWNALGNPSGIYFARLTTPDFHQTIKMLLIR